MTSTLRFFAAADDQRAILDFVFGETDAVVVPLSSAPGEELPFFHSTVDVGSQFALGEDVHGGGTAITLMICSPSVQKLEIRRVNFDPKHIRSGPLFRYEPAGFGLIQLYFGGVHGRTLTKSYIGHNSQQRAEAWGALEGVEWAALDKLGSKIRYHISRRLAVAKAGSLPVLRHAFNLKEAGFSLKEAARSPWEYELVAKSAPN